MCKSWTTAHELGSVVSRSLIALRKKHPGIGWVRGDKVPTSDANAEMLKLRKRIEELEADLNKSRTEPPVGAAGLAQHDEIFEIGVNYNTTKQVDEDLEDYEWDHSVPMSWNELFFTVSPLLIHEATTHQIHLRLKEEVRDKVDAQFREVEGQALDEDHVGHNLYKNGINVSQTDLETVVVQFLALGYIEHSAKHRSVKDRGDYWTLTPYGATVMNQLRAIPSGSES